MTQPVYGQEPLDELLRHELTQFALNLGWTERLSELSASTATALANLAERLSRSAATDGERRKCLMICALLWEHRRPEWLALRGMLFLILARLGLGPSARMLGREHENEDYFDSLGSLMLESTVTAHLIQREVLTHGKTLLLSGFQKRVWDSMGSCGKLGISAPTSAGKSHVLVNRLLDLLRPGEQCLYVVPTISLVQQVMADFRKAILSRGLHSVGVSQTVTDVDSQFVRFHVLTQERALAAISRPESVERLRVAVFDEIQNIERIAKDSEERAHTLREVIRVSVTELAPEKLIICGARIGNLRVLTEELLGDNSETVTDEVPTVANVTYSILFRKKEAVLRQHTDLFSAPLEMPVTVPGLRSGGQKYGSDVLKVIGHVSDRLGDGGVLVFSPTSTQATSTAVDIASRRTIKSVAPSLKLLSDYLMSSVHELYPLANTVSAGVGYHHGKMPHHARSCVEAAFKDRSLNTVACTTTLMQGVNLPAKTLVARNPDLFIMRRSGQVNVQLTGYEFSNLRGRAGRLMQDFVGRAVVLDEQSFNSLDIDLATQPSKDVSANYRDRFNDNRDPILTSLGEDAPVARTMDAPDLVLFVRRMVLKYSDAQQRLAQVGIEIPEQELARIRRQLNALTVPVELCLQLPFWDPFVLQKLHETRFPRLPSSPFASFRVVISQILDLLETVAPYYFEKFIGAQSVNQRLELTISAEHWCRETSLKEILTRVKDPGLTPSTIDHRVSVVTDQVSFHLPQLLRPIALMQNPENPILGMMEIGAYQPVTRRMIELGIPREVACSLSRSGLQSTDGSNVSLVAEIRARLPRCNFWEQRQLKYILPELSV